MTNLLDESQHQRLAEAIGGKVISRRAITTPDGHVIDVSVAGVVRADGRAIGRTCDGVDRIARAYRAAIEASEPAVTLTASERADLFNAACRAHRGPETFVCRPCADAQDAAIERVIAARLAAS